MLFHDFTMSLLWHSCYSYIRYILRANAPITIKLTAIFWPVSLIQTWGTIESWSPWTLVGTFHIAHKGFVWSTKRNEMTHESCCHETQSVVIIKIMDCKRTFVQLPECVESRNITGTPIKLCQTYRDRVPFLWLGKIRAKCVELEPWYTTLLSYRVIEQICL